MNSNDFTYKKTKAFMRETDVDTFDPFEYLEVVPVKDKNIEDDDNLTNPLIVKEFPWNEEFVGMSFVIGKIDVKENNDGTASLSYNYNMLNNPKDLPIAANNEISRDNEVNELLDAFIGRVIESSLVKMSNDKDFMKEVMKEASLMFVGLLLLFAGTIDYMLLAFAYRDFSWGLVGMFMLSPIGIPLGYYLLIKAVKGSFKWSSLNQSGVY